MLKNKRRSEGMKIFSTIIFFLVLAVTFPCYAEDLLHGRSVYEVNCASCHGEFGKGDGPRAEAFDPRPTDFTDPEVMAKITPERFERSIVQGLPEIADHTFGHLLTPEEVRDVTKYVRSLAR